MSTPIVQLLPIKPNDANASKWNYHPDTTCEAIPVDKPCFLTLWGYLTTKDFVTLRQVEKYAIFDPDTVNMYGNLYEAPFVKDGRAILIVNTLIKPIFHQYVNSIFNVAVLPRIVKDGKKLSADIAQENMNNLTIFTHSYGSCVADYIIKTLDTTLKNLEYKPEEIAAINKQLVVITQSPVKVLYDKPATVVNFVSLADTAAGYKKILSDVEIENPTFVVDYDMLMTPGIYTEEAREKAFKKQGTIEHRLWNIESNELSDQGKITIDMLTNLLHNAIDRKEVKDLFDLFADKKPVVTALKTLDVNLPHPAVLNASLYVNIGKYIIQNFKKYFRIKKR